jgi:Protein of unknown function (DUF3426)/zinc-ribbon domain
MEVRCGKCNKLFCVSDDKITGSGIKFACSRCGEYVKITQADFEQYNLSQAAVSVLASHEPKPATARTSFESEIHAVASAPAAAPSADEFPPEDKAPPAFVQPAPQPQEKPIESKPSAPAMQPHAPLSKPAEASRPEPASKPLPKEPSAPSGRSEEAVHPELSSILSATPAASSGAGKKLLVIIAVLVVLVLAAALGAKWYFGKASQQVSDAVKTATSPEGLLIQNASGAIDPGNQDLVITGAIQNTTDKPRPAWYVVAEVYDAQNTVLVRAKMLSGKQIYTRRDYDILVKRGQNVQELKMKMQEPGTVIPPKSTVNFEIRIIEPPVGIASFNATLQPFDPVQLFKEIVEEQKPK